MANDRWRDDERQRWDSDRDRYRREGSGRQDFGRGEAQRRDWERSESSRRDFGRQDYGRQESGRQDYGSDDYWRRAYGRDSDRNDYGRSYQGESSGRGEGYGRDERYSRRDYGSGTGSSGSSYGGSGYSGSGYGGSGYGSSGYSGSGSSSSGYDRSGYGSSNYSEPSRDRDRESEYRSSPSRSEYDYERYTWGAGLAEWPAPIADWRTGYRGQREQRSDRDWRARESDRGWWDRTKDEVRSWMGDEEAERRRRMDMERMGMSGEGQRRGHMGRGPKGYTRSDQRILEDVSDRLTEDWSVDASEIEVAVSGCEVTLSGTVDSRDAKRRAENIAADVTGVKDVQNNLRVRQAGTQQVGTNLTGSSSAALEQTTGLSSRETQPGTTGTSGQKH